MNLIVDTSVWSEAFRKKHEPKTNGIVLELGDAIQEGRVVMLGAIRQELLSGIKHHEMFLHLRNQMRGFPDFPVTEEDYESAAEIFNRLRAKGIQGSNTDFLICSVSLRTHLPIFTTDKDFDMFSKHIKIHLHRWA